jgi:hypothetical protein
LSYYVHGRNEDRNDTHGRNDDIPRRNYNNGNDIHDTNVIHDRNNTHGRNDNDWNDCHGRI